MKANGVIASRDARTSHVRYDYDAVQLYCRCGWWTLLYHARWSYLQQYYVQQCYV
ncbi:hypothetical protein QWJ20_11825 [Pectobacterium sp. S5]